MICGPSALSVLLESKPTYVAVTSEMLQQLDLSQGPLGQDLLAEDIGDFLDGDTITGLGVGRGTESKTCEHLY